MVCINTFPFITLFNALNFLIKRHNNLTNKDKHYFGVKEWKKVFKQMKPGTEQVLVF